MADLLTVYDDGEANSFIECKICEKRIRGDTNHKIHLTTLQHYKRNCCDDMLYLPVPVFPCTFGLNSAKREKTLADKGFLPQPTPLPQWTNIKEYLLYLNLNEPIIGLSTLVQEEDSVSGDGMTLLRYRCRLCAVQMDLSDMATHVVGRKHRQKYLERYRPELVTWENNSEKQAGVVARAKAAIVEKQEGWGNPVPMRLEKGRSGRNQGLRFTSPQSRSSNVRGKAPSGHDRSRQNSYNHSRMDDDTNRKPSRYHENNQYNQSYRDDIHNHRSGSKDNRYDQPYSQDGRQRRSFEERDYMETPYWEDKQSRGAFSGERSPDRQAYTDEREPQPYDDEWYPTERPSKGAYNNREDDDYYHANRYNDLGLDYQESGGMRDPVYTSHHDAGPSMDDRQWQSRNLPYAEREREHYQNPDGTERRGSYEMQDFSKRQSYFPTEDELPTKKQKKSRFSDASPLDIAMLKTSQIDDTILKPKRTVPYMQSRASGSNMDLAVTPRMENVLNVLNDIQINNVEEANFLKDKLHSLLKEFQSNKAQRNQSHALQSSDFTDSYHGINNMEPRRDMPQPRRLDDHSFQEPMRYSRDMQVSRDYSHNRHAKEDQGMMRQSRVPQEPEYQWHSHREGSAGRPEKRTAYRPNDRRVHQEPIWNSRPLREEERGYNEHHQYRRDYHSGGDPYDPFEPSSSPPLESSNPTLDKLASTLLELVARKVN